MRAMQVVPWSSKLGVERRPKHHPVNNLCRENREVVWEGTDKGKKSTRFEETKWG